MERRLQWPLHRHCSPHSAGPAPAPRRGGARRGRGPTPWWRRALGGAWARRSRAHGARVHGAQTHLWRSMLSTTDTNSIMHTRQPPRPWPTWPTQASTCCAKNCWKSSCRQTEWKDTHTHAQNSKRSARQSTLRERGHATLGRAAVRVWPLPSRCHCLHWPCSCLRRRGCWVGGLPSRRRIAGSCRARSCC